MVAVRGYRWVHRWRAGATLLALTAALISALAVVDPARADDAPTVPADSAATTTETPAAPAADQPAADAPASTDPAPPPPDPEPTPQPDPTPTEPAPEEPATSGGTTGAPADPAPDAPAGDPVAVQPDTQPTDPVTTCAEASGADGAQAGACEPAGGNTDAVSPPAACDTTAADAAASACTEQAPASTPAAATTPKVASTSAPPAAQPAAPASELVVTLAPASGTTVPVPAGPVVAPAGEPEDPVVVGPTVVAPTPVQLVQPIVPVAKIDAGVSSGPALATKPTVGILAPAVSTDSLAYAPVVPVALPPLPIGALVSAGARAAPSETDQSHREVTREAEPPPEPEAVDPFTPFDVHGPGAGVGRGGGVPGAATQFRHVAIVPTPLGFAFPSAFAYSPAPSSAPEGALEDAPTTRPG